MRRGKGKRNIKRGIYILPSIITSLSLFCGFYSITASIRGSFLTSAWAIILAALFDGFDGRIARLTRSVSRFGEHYDSLADMISFGVAPGIMIYSWALSPFGRWGWLVTFLYIICVALRLARFNVQASIVERKEFQGLPSPPSAVMLAATVILSYHLGIANVKNITIPILSCLLSMLMVSTINYYSFKDYDFRKRRPFSVLVVLVLILIIVIGEPEIMLFLGTAGYVLSGPSGLLIKIREKRRSQQSNAQKEKPYIYTA